MLRDYGIFCEPSFIMLLMSCDCSVFSAGPGNFPVSVLLNGTNLGRGRHLSLLTPFLKCCPYTTMRISSYSSHTQCFELRRVGGILDFAVIRQTTFLSFCSLHLASVIVRVCSVEETIFRLVLIIP